MRNRDEGRAIARQELRTKRASWPALNMVKCMWRQPHPPVEFAVIRLEGGPTESHSRLSIDALFGSAAMPPGVGLIRANENHTPAVGCKWSHYIVEAAHAHS
jgi:hypothetical protein